MSKQLGLLLVLAIGLVGCTTSLNSEGTQETENESTQSVVSPTPDAIDLREFPESEIVVTNLEIPWELVFLPDGRALVTERPGRVRLIDNQWQLQEEPVLSLEAVRQAGEGGLLGMALDPEFASNSFVYVYYTYGNLLGVHNRVERFRWDGSTLVSDKIIVDALPGSNARHNGGRIAFGPDGYLYIGTGDVNDDQQAQQLDSLAGKILRVTREGEPAPGNPFGTIVYSYGHRNPQGLAWDTQGRLWATEHGPTAHDELNLIIAGTNYGWPVITGKNTGDGLVPPVIESGTGTWAPSGLTAWNGSLFFTGLRGTTLFEAILNDTQGVSRLERHLGSEFGRLRQIVVGPDGLFYVLTNNRDGRGTPTAEDDRIIRVNQYKI